eukprot:1722510-Amphidinium_carterae.1
MAWFQPKSKPHTMTVSALGLCKGFSGLDVTFFKSTLTAARFVAVCMSNGTQAVPTVSVVCAMRQAGSRCHR